MTPSQPISAGQRKKLLIMWHQYATRSLDVIGDERSARLAWASGMMQRKIGSFNDLSAMEAARAISALNKSMGMPRVSAERAPDSASTARGRSGTRSPMDKARGEAAGTHGRRGSDRSVAEIVSNDDLARIERAIERLGWDRKRFDAWLSSPSSPLGRHKQIKTVADANRVWWAMKRMLQREGKWED